MYSPLACMAPLVPESLGVILKATRETLRKGEGASHLTAIHSTQARKPTYVTVVICKDAGVEAMR